MLCAEEDVVAREELADRQDCVGKEEGRLETIETHALARGGRQAKQRQKSCGLGQEPEKGDGREAQAWEREREQGGVVAPYSVCQQSRAAAADE